MPTEGMEAQNWNNRIWEEKHKDIPFPRGESSNRGFWKLLWDVITTGRESGWPGAYLAWEELRHLCVHFSIVWRTLIPGKHCLKSRVPIVPCVMEPLRNRQPAHPVLPRDSRGGMQGHVLVPICVGHRGVRQKGHESSRDNKEPFCLKYTVLGSSPKLSMAGSLVLRPWSLQRI